MGEGTAGSDIRCGGCPGRAAAGVGSDQTPCSSSLTPAVLKGAGPLEGGFPTSAHRGKGTGDGAQGGEHTVSAESSQADFRVEMFPWKGRADAFPCQKTVLFCSRSLISFRMKRAGVDGTSGVGPA